MDDGVALAYVSQELVAQAFALAGALHEAGNVDDVADCGHNAARVHEFGELGQSFIGDRYLAELCIDGTEREIGCLSLCR